MKWQIAVVGKPALDYAKSGVSEYTKRLGRYASVEITYLKDSDHSRLDKLTEGAVCVVLDERGDEWTTTQFEKRVTAWESDGAVKRVVFCIGGADGHDESVRVRADATLALSRFTMQHELALVVFLEQLYRVFTLKRGEPYHRE